MSGPRSKPRLALFDIDGTLLREPSSEKRFMLWMFLRGRIGLIRLLAYAVFALRYLPRYGAQVFANNKSLLWRHRSGSTELLAKEWAARRLARALFPPCVERLRLHQQRGDIVVLLSGTPDFLAEAIAGQLGVTNVVATRCAAHDGRFSFAPPKVHRVADAKLTAAKQLCRQFEVSLARTAAYANSITDLPLLAACGVPVAVNPDPALAVVAVERGWEIVANQTHQRIRASA